MREIKFRAKREHWKEFGGWDKWVYANGYYHDGINYWFTLPKDNPAIAWAKQVLIDIETLGQYIGLLDKNKVEIYDGDIAKSIHNFYYVFGERLGYTKENCDEGNWLIEWSGMGFHGKPISEKCLGSSLTFGRDYPNAEVIGNKWENLELLEKTE